MKKYNLSEIMKKAWELVRTLGLTMSAGLKAAWKLAKAAAEKIAFNGYAKVLKEGCNGTSKCDYFAFKEWEKKDKRRIYVSDYKGRSVGYIDATTGEIVTEFNNRSEPYREMARFLEAYTF